MQTVTQTNTHLTQHTFMTVQILIVSSFETIELLISDNFLALGTFDSISKT